MVSPWLLAAGAGCVVIMNHAEPNWNRDRLYPAQARDGEIDLICQTTEFLHPQEYS